MSSPDLQGWRWSHSCLLCFRLGIIPSDQIDSFHSILGRGRVSGLSPAEMVTRSLAPLPTLRALSQRFLLFQ